MKRLIVISDTHCGSKLGLTPEKWQQEELCGKAPSYVWNWFDTQVKTVGKIDACVWNGDLIDGRGRKETNDHLTTNLSDQKKMAIDVIEHVGAKQNYFVYGTGYHVTDGEDQEDAIAEHFGTVPHTSLSLDVGGKLFDFRHHSGKTSIPHGQGTLITKQLLWNLMHDVIDGERRADVVVRSHVHEYVCIDTCFGTAITTPAMQLPGSSYGRKYVGHYHVGFIEILVKDRIAIIDHRYKIQRNKKEYKVD